MPKTAIRQGLRVVFESIGRSLRPRIRNRQRQFIFFQHEVHARSRALDRPRHHIARHAQTLRVSVIPHAVQFFDGDVIALAVLHARVGQIAQRQHNQHRHRPEFQIFAGFARHELPHPCQKLYAPDSPGSRRSRFHLPGRFRKGAPAFTPDREWSETAMRQLNTLFSVGCTRGGPFFGNSKIKSMELLDIR